MGVGWDSRHSRCTAQAACSYEDMPNPVEEYNTKAPVIMREIRAERDPGHRAKVCALLGVAHDAVVSWRDAGGSSSEALDALDAAWSAAT